MRYTNRCMTTITTADNNYIIIAIENNQRCQRRKQQREGTSNMFIVVTHSMAIKPLTNTCRCYNVAPGLERKSSITYVDQAIVSVDSMSGCENVHTLDDVISYITRENTVNIPVLPDYSGERVNSYYNVMNICYGLLQ